MPMNLRARSQCGRNENLPRIIRLMSVIALVVALLACNDKGANTPVINRAAVEEGKPAPMFTLKGLDGKIVNLSDLKGSVVLINFWATWCPPCKGEMPSLQKLYAVMMDDPKFVMYGILYKDDPVNAQRFTKENGIMFPMLVDSNYSASGAYGITGVPETYIIDKKGLLRQKIIGPAEFDSPDAIAFFKSLLAEAP